MPLHLGRGVTVRAADVVALTDLQKPLSADTAALLSALRAAGRVHALGPEPKTMVLCAMKGGALACYLSCVGLRTLRLRAEDALGAAMGRSEEE